jgi:inhibitor of KinA
MSDERVGLTREMQLIALGETAVAVRFGNAVDRSVHRRVQALAGYLEQHPFPGMIEVVPAYAAVTVYYDPWIVAREESFFLLFGQEAIVPGERTPSEAVMSVIENYASMADQMADTDAEGRIVEIPVCYGGEYGPDLEEVAAFHGLTADQAVELHAGTDYSVYMIGFAPGFPYLGGLDKRLHTPRRAAPRLKVAAGTVGIGGSQTGVYPLETPGGWQLIGRTPLPLFLPEQEPPALLRAGDTVRFVPITPREFARWQGRESP